MGLSDDQRAMLRLLAQRGEQGYEDIAALKGLSVDEVRAQVAQALAQLDEEGALSATPPPAAEPEAKAPAESPKPEPPAPEPAEAVPAAAEAAPPEAKQPRPPRSAPKLSLPSGGGLRAAIAAGVAVVALIAIILVVSDGGEDESSAGSTPTSAESSSGASDESSSGASDESTAGNAATNSAGVTKAVLEPVAGGDAKGVAIFGKVGQGKKESLALEVAIEGLEATGKDDAYTIWLSQSPRRMLPLASTEVGKTGKIAGQYEIPVEVLAYLANETFKDLVVTKTTNSTLEAALAKATKEGAAPAYTGDEVLRGTVTGPVVGAQVRQEELEKEEKEGE
ncbi:MAG: hypothetical protein ACOYD4_05050 [Solirubrobacterales bacterium]